MKVLGQNELNINLIKFSRKPIKGLGKTKLKI